MVNTLQLNRKKKKREEEGRREGMEAGEGEKERGGKKEGMA